MNTTATSPRRLPYHRPTDRNLQNKSSFWLKKPRKLIQHSPRRQSPGKIKTLFNHRPFWYAIHVITSQWNNTVTEQENSQRAREFEINELLYVRKIATAINDMSRSIVPSGNACIDSVIIGGIQMRPDEKPGGPEVQRMFITFLAVCRDDVRISRWITYGARVFGIWNTSGCRWMTLPAELTDDAE